MSRRRAKRAPYDVKRGRHHKAASAETQRWNAEHLIPPQPAYFDAATYRALAALRRELHG